MTPALALPFSPINPLWQLRAFAQRWRCPERGENPKVLPETTTSRDLVLAFDPKSLTPNPKTTNAPAKLAVLRVGK